MIDIVKKNVEEEEIKILEEIRLIRAGLICCNQPTEHVEGDQSGLLRHCPKCMCNYKLKEGKSLLAD